MLKFTLKKESIQSESKNYYAHVCDNDETVNISKFPLLYVTPERVKIEPGYTKDLNMERVKSTTQLPIINDKSPINMSFASIKRMDNECTFIYPKDSNTLPLAYINQISNSPLCSTAIVNSCCSCCNSTRHEETCTCDKSNEQFHSVNGSFFDFNRQQLDTLELYYVCFQSFQATNDGQISLDYSDLVKLIYTKGDFYLVQNVMNEKRGYVPKSVISKLTQAWVSEKSIFV